MAADCTRIATERDGATSLLQSVHKHAISHSVQSRYTCKHASSVQPPGLGLFESARCYAGVRMVVAALGSRSLRSIGDTIMRRCNGPSGSWRRPCWLLPRSRRGQRPGTRGLNPRFSRVSEVDGSARAVGALVARRRARPGAYTAGSTSSGRATTSSVPAPGGLSILIVPPRASTRSCKPTSPEPWPESAPPTPSSRIDSSRTPSRGASETSIRDACACFVALARPPTQRSTPRPRSAQRAVSSS